MEGGVGCETRGGASISLFFLSLVKGEEVKNEGGHTSNRGRNTRCCSELCRKGYFSPSSVQGTLEERRTNSEGGSFEVPARLRGSVGLVGVDAAVRVRRLHEKSAKREEKGKEEGGVDCFGMEGWLNAQDGSLVAVLVVVSDVGEPVSINEDARGK